MMSLKTMDTFDTIQSDISTSIKEDDDSAYYSQCIIPDIEKIVEEIYEETKIECAKYGYNCYRKFDMIFIRTPFDLWCFEARRGKIQLKHCEKEIYNAHKEFHTHFKAYISIENLILYIFEHTQAKFTSEFIHFSTEVEEVGRV